MSGGIGANAPKSKIAGVLMVGVVVCCFSESLSLFH